jgi:hypothetical protein
LHYESKEKSGGRALKKRTKNVVFYITKTEKAADAL